MTLWYIVVGEALGVGFMVLSLVGTGIACMVSTWCWLTTRPMAVRRLEENLSRLAVAQNELATAHTRVAAESANDLVAAEHEREIAQDYNRRSAQRANRAVTVRDNGHPEFDPDQVAPGAGFGS